MHQTTRGARKGGHLSRHERQRLARANALSRRSAATSPPVSSVKLVSADLELIDQLVRRDRTVVSSALMAVAGIGADEAARRVVLARVTEATCWAQGAGRSAQTERRRSPGTCSGRRR